MMSSPNPAARPRSRAAFLAAVAVLAVGCGQRNEYHEPPPPEVVAAKPASQPVTNYLEYTGTAQASERVELRARVRGFLKERKFRDGDFVKEGQLLFVIDEEPFRVRLSQAKAREEEATSALAKSERSKAREIARAQLELSLSQLRLAKIEAERDRKLLSRNAGTREDVDRAEANESRGEAQVASDRASLEQAQADFELNIQSARSSLDAARADVRNAEIDLGYCRVTAPIDGQINARQFDVGNYVGEGESVVLSTIVRIDPIYAYVTPSESDLVRVRTTVPKGRHLDLRDASIVMEMGLGDDPGYPHHGTLDYSDPSVDAGTGTGRVRGSFPNPDRVIVPGLFVRVRIPYERQEAALLVPARALGTDQGGPFLLVIGEQDKVERRPVRPGRAVGPNRVIESGIGPEDRVVVEGLLRARPGLKVAPRVGVTGVAAAPKDERPATH